MDSAFFRHNQDFVLFGRQHLLMILLTAALCIALPVLAKRILNRRQQIWVARGMSLAFSVWVILYIVIRIGLGDFDRTIDVPLDICNLVALFLPFLMWNPSQKVHEVLYFWILAGTFQAVLTPYLFNGFPNFTFIKYWIVHGGESRIVGRLLEGVEQQRFGTGIQIHETNTHSDRLTLVDPGHDALQHELFFDITEMEKKRDVRPHVQRTASRPNVQASGADIVGFRVDEMGPTRPLEENT
jgi:hypothetical protein